MNAAFHFAVYRFAVQRTSSCLALSVKLKLSHLEESDLLRSQETPFAAAYILLGQTGKRNAVEVHYLIPYFLEYAAHNAVLTGVDLQTDMLAVGFRELQSIRNNALVIQYYTGTDNSFIHFVQFMIQRNGIFLWNFG